MPLQQGGASLPDVLLGSAPAKSWAQNQESWVAQIGAVWPGDEVLDEA